MHRLAMLSTVKLRLASVEKSSALAVEVGAGDLQMSLPTSVSSCFCLSGNAPQLCGSGALSILCPHSPEDFCEDGHWQSISSHKQLIGIGAPEPRKRLGQAGYPLCPQCLEQDPLVVPLAWALLQPTRCSRMCPIHQAVPQESSRWIKCSWRGCSAWSCMSGGRAAAPGGSHTTKVDASRLLSPGSGASLYFSPHADIGAHAEGVEQAGLLFSSQLLLSVVEKAEHVP